MAKFKVGDRVRVVEVDRGDGCEVGETGTVAEVSSVPWVSMDVFNSRRMAVSQFGIPEGRGVCLSERQLELVVEPESAKAERTAADDYRDYGIAFEVDGERVDPRRVLVYWPSVVRRDD